MKNVLDHRILIPRSPETVWEYISDFSNNSHWQTDCKQVSFLTSRRSGVGVRWRYQTEAGNDCVVETTAWYEGLGYEYTYVDGLPFEETRGRIRLQEIAEGTVVQWTFSYDTKGLLGGVRNALGVRRQTTNIMMDSLRQLWRKLNQSGSGEPVREVKSLIQAAPDYEERSRYRPRHPSKKDPVAPGVMADTEPVIVEPPVTDEDTRPSVRVVLPEPESRSDQAPLAAEGSPPPGDAEGTPVPEASASAESANDQTAREVTTSGEEASETQPDALVTKVPLPRAEAPSADVAANVLPETDAVHESPSKMDSAVPARASTPMPATDYAAATTIGEEGASEAESLEDTALAVLDRPGAQVALSESISPEELAAMDTREISVFDVFGLPKPSETQEMSAVVPEDAAPEPQAEPRSAPRVGLRMLLRRRLVRLRRPA